MEGLVFFAFLLADAKWVAMLRIEKAFSKMYLIMCSKLYKNKYKKIIISLDKKESCTYVLDVKKIKKREKLKKAREKVFFCSRNVPFFPSFLNGMEWVL